MLQVSQNVKNACASNVSRHSEYILVKNSNNTTTRVDISGKLYATAYKDTSFFGTFNTKTLEFETSDDVQYLNKELEYYKKVNGEAFKIGTFIVTDVQGDDSNESVKVSCNDYGLKFAVPYETELNYASGEVTLYQVLQEACTKAGVVLENESIDNGSFIVDSNQFVNGEMIGDVISAIAGISGNFATITENDELRLMFTNNTNEILEDYTDLKDKRDSWPITSVSIGTSQVEGQEATMRDETLIEEYGEHWLTINDNPFAYTLEKRFDLVEAIFNKVKGFGYSSFTSEYTYKPYLTLGDKIKFRNKEGTLVDSIVLRYTQEYDKCVFEAPSITSSSINYETAPKAEVVAKRAEIIANQATAEISSTVQRIEEVQDDVNENYYNMSEVDTLIQSTDSGLTNILAKAGGNNLIRNSALLFKDTNNNYEFWEGDLERGDADTYNVISETGSVILTQSGGASQSIKVVPDTYTLSFKYKRISVTSDITFSINKQEVTFEDEAEGEITQSFDNGTDNITIAFESDVDNGYIIYDLMLNKGNVALDYSQNANETTTDTVKIGKGIAVVSDSTDTITRVDSDGFRVLGKDNESDVLLKATDSGTETKTIKVREWAEISGLRFQETNNQTWITGII